MTKQPGSNILQYVAVAVAVEKAWQPRHLDMVLVRAVHTQVSNGTRRAEVPLAGIYCRGHGRRHEEDARHIQYGSTALLRSRLFR
jgi:hypothetical protein